MHTQFSKLCQETTLYKAWDYVKSKGSAGGIDGVTIETFSKDKIRQIKVIRYMRGKHFYVVAYDISDDKRRRKVVKLMESIGTRMNYSVFECMLTEIQYKNMCKRLTKLVIKKEDWVNIYPICTECYARIEYIPPIKKKEPIKIAIV